nr:MAG TPA: hypothetical protein [Caudoviricetes sp.]
MPQVGMANTSLPLLISYYQLIEKSNQLKLS